MIQNLASGGAPSAYRFSPVNLGQEPPAALPPDTSRLSAAQSQAALMGTVAKTISDLPSVLVGSYLKGKQLGLEDKAANLTSSALDGTPLSDTQRAALSGLSYSPAGVSFAPPKPMTALETAEKTADVQLKQAHAKYYAEKVNGSGGYEANPLASAFAPVGPAPGTASGVVTSYGEKGDRYGGPGSAPATSGAFGTGLTPQSLAVSPDIEGQLRSKGYKPGDHIALQLADGSSVDRVWDDRTAQDDPTGTWAVDDKGNKISDGKGGFLKALRGRWDFRADANGQASPHAGKSVVGFAKAGEPALPASDPGLLPATDPSLTPAPSAVAPASTFGALADGSPEPASAPTPMGALADAQTTVSAPPTSSAATPAPAIPTPPHAGNVVADDGTVNADAALAAKNGVKLTDEGHAGGVVTRYQGFDKEEAPDGTVYIYPHRVKPGQKQFTVFKKPGGGTAVPAQIKTEAVRMGVWKDNMSAEDASKAMEDKSLQEGVIPPHLLPAAESMARFVVGHPALKHLPTIREAKETVDAGLADPDAGGFSDMALIEGFQRMVNPGATVRTQTMQNMKEAAGWLQQLDPSYQWKKAVEGDKFTTEARQRLKKLSDDIYGRAMKGAGPQLAGLKKVAKSYGISNPDSFIDNVMTMAPMYDAGGSTASPSLAPAPGAAPGPAGSGSNMTNPMRVKTQNDYNALPAGTWFIDGSGQLKQKGAKPSATNNPPAAPTATAIEG